MGSLQAASFRALSIKISVFKTLFLTISHCKKYISHCNSILPRVTETEVHRHPCHTMFSDLVPALFVGGISAGHELLH